MSEEATAWLLIAIFIAAWAGLALLRGRKEKRIETLDDLKEKHPADERDRL